MTNPDTIPDAVSAARRLARLPPLLLGLAVLALALHAAILAHLLPQGWTGAPLAVVTPTEPTAAQMFAALTGAERAATRDGLRAVRAQLGTADTTPTGATLAEARIRLDSLIASQEAALNDAPPALVLSALVNRLDAALQGFGPAEPAGARTLAGATLYSAVVLALMSGLLAILRSGRVASAPVFVAVAPKPATDLVEEAVSALRQAADAVGRAVRQGDADLARTSDDARAAIESVISLGARLASAAVDAEARLLGGVDRAESTLLRLASPASAGAATLASAASPADAGTAPDPARLEAMLSRMAAVLTEAVEGAIAQAMAAHLSSTERGMVAAERAAQEAARIGAMLPDLVAAIEAMGAQTNERLAELADSIQHGDQAASDEIARLGQIAVLIETAGARVAAAAASVGQEAEHVASATDAARAAMAAIDAMAAASGRVTAAERDLARCVADIGDAVASLRTPLPHPDWLSPPTWLLSPPDWLSARAAVPAETASSVPVGRLGSAVDRLHRVEGEVDRLLGEAETLVETVMAGDGAEVVGPVGPEVLSLVEATIRRLQSVATAFAVVSDAGFDPQTTQPALRRAG